MIRTIYRDPERYRKAYFPEELGGKLYLAGDGSVRDVTTGYFTIMGASTTCSTFPAIASARWRSSRRSSRTRSSPRAAVVGRPDDTDRRGRRARSSC
jgi:acetyl-CoA synthetase